MKLIDVEGQIDGYLLNGQLEDADLLVAQRSMRIAPSEKNAPFENPFRLNCESDPLAVIGSAPSHTRLTHRLRNTRSALAMAMQQPQLRVAELGDFGPIGISFWDDLPDCIAVTSLTALGNTAQQMALDTGVLDCVHENSFDAFVLTAGGNDILGQGRLVELLNDNLEKPALNPTQLSRALNETVLNCRAILNVVSQSTPDLAMFVRGYAVPDITDAPRWLDLPFSAINRDLASAPQVIRTVVAALNAALCQLALSIPNCTYIAPNDDTGIQAADWFGPLMSGRAGAMAHFLSILGGVEVLSQPDPAAFFDHPVDQGDSSGSAPAHLLSDLLCSRLGQSFHGP